jgi:hypothetical protein
LVLWFNRAGVQHHAEKFLNRKLSDDELDLVVKSYDETDFGEGDAFKQAIKHCVKSLLESGAIKKEG